MAKRFIIDDATGALYEDFTARRVVSAADILEAEGGASETIQIYLVTHNPQTRAVATTAIATANVSLDIGVPGASPTAGKVIVSYGGESTAELPVATLTADSLRTALNRLDAVEDDGGVDVWLAGDLEGMNFYVQLQSTGTPGTSPSVDTDGATPPSSAEITVITAGSSSERALWLVQIAEAPVASIAESAWSTVTSGSFGGLTAALSLNGKGLLAHLAKDNPPPLTMTVKNSGSVLLRGTIPAFQAVDPTDLNGSAILSIFPRIVTSTSNPAVTDDAGDGYAVGTLWVNTSADTVFILSDSTVGAAVWPSSLPLGGGTMTGALNVGQDGTGHDVKFFGDTSGRYLHWDESEDKLILSGDFDVTGTTTTFNSTVVKIADPIFTLGGTDPPGSDDNKDRGIEFHYHDGSAARVGFFGYDDSASAFTFLTAATNSSEVFSGTAGNLVAGELTASTIGIGTDDPTETLHIRDGRTSGGSSGLLIQKFEDVVGTSYGAFIEATGASTKNIGLYVQAEGGTTNYGLVVPNGRVGIGTAVPDTLVEVRDDSAVSKDLLHIRSGCDNAHEYVGLKFTTAAGGAGPHAAIRTYLGPYGFDSYLSLLTTTDGGTLTQGLTQAHNGFVGINTTVPSSLLDVRGDAGAPGILTLSTAETTVVADDVLGKIQFSAPLEADGSAAVAIAASIHAVATDTFVSSTNATDIVFSTAQSEAASEKMRLTSAGQVLLQNGTVTLPSFAFASAPSRGFYAPATNHFVWAANSTPQISFLPSAVAMRSDMELGWASGNAYGTAVDVKLYRDAASILGLRVNGAAQEFRIYSDLGDPAGNYERGSFAMDTSGDLTIATEAGGTGTVGKINLDGTVVVAGLTQLKVYTVSALPAQPIPAGSRAFVSDSNAAWGYAIVGATVAAGGSYLVPVYSDGTYWKCG